VEVTIPTSAGGMPGYLSRPGGDGRWPGVVVLHDGFGIDAAVRAQADWLAGAGYLALSVDLGFWGRPSACLLRMFRDLRAGRARPSARSMRRGRGWPASPDATAGWA
jgi:carboxymethylenebutenolidase